MPLSSWRSEVPWSEEMKPLTDLLRPNAPSSDASPVRSVLAPGSKARSP